MSSAFSWLNQIYRSNSLRKGFVALNAFVLLIASVPSKPAFETKAKHYGEVQIGNQVWMTENLDVASFRNGDLIPEAKSDEEWQKAGKQKRPAWCYYKNDARIGKKYGRMYNWYAVTDPRGLCPQGWHVPTLAEWIQFEKAVEGREADLLFRCDGNKDQKINNQSKGFCTLAGGYRATNGFFTGIDEFIYLSGATEDIVEDEHRILQPILWGRNLHVIERSIMRCGLCKEFGLYVRCIKDESQSSKH